MERFNKAYYRGAFTKTHFPDGATIARLFMETYSPIITVSNQDISADNPSSLTNNLKEVQNMSVDVPILPDETWTHIFDYVRPSWIRIIALALTNKKMP